MPCVYQVRCCFDVASVTRPSFSKPCLTTSSAAFSTSVVWLPATAAFMPASWAASTSRHSSACSFEYLPFTGQARVMSAVMPS